MQTYYIRIGSLAEIHVANASLELQRGTRIIARTPRGVECGEVLRVRDDDSKSTPMPAITILRAMTDQDSMLVSRLQRDKPEAIAACRQKLQQLGTQSVLLDVDHLFDGTLIMHFLGEVDNIAENNKTELAATYESIVKSQDVAKQLTAGCGPDCGTKAGGCSTGGCSTCSVKCVSASG